MTRLARHPPPGPGKPSARRPTREKTLTEPASPVTWAQIKARLGEITPLIAAAALAAGLSACGTPGQPPSQPRPVSTTAAAAWVRAHPVPARQRMIAGILIRSAATGTGRYRAWSATLVTSGGRTVTVTCRDDEWAGAVLGVSCDLPLPVSPGDYAYLPSGDPSPGGLPLDPVQVIKRGAVRPS
jgi:hypothetical protein